MTLWPETFTVWPTPEATREVIEVPAQGITVEEEATTSHEVTMGAVHEVTLGVTPQTTAARMMAGQDTADKVEEDMITNEIEADILTRQSWSVKEQMVELTIQLKGEIYTDALKDPFSFYYQRLAQQFIEKISILYNHILPCLYHRGRAVVVHCAVTLEVDGGISKETLDYINLQSNLVGNSYTELDERPTVVYTITDFRNYITEALHKENFIGNTTLAVDPNTLQLENGTVWHYQQALLGWLHGAYFTNPNV
ncbi:hypothetical protein SKAU_G00233620 [Synaphobranchus kaupii]|uniref:SEA domain-containing protein n=1 Tax=Synaphobranchus kaupii TaxID=118154 RepID=A0A9Q1F654_SYNKA|nr:hypothetical protein SKAU_G00233620 [Synaphobranchus kaupii]